MPMGCCTISETGLTLRVRLTPKGGRDAIDGRSVLANGQEVVRARVRAAPEKGAANKALVTLMARELGVAKSEVALVAGGTSRLKTLAIKGDGATLAAVVDGWPRG